MMEGLLEQECTTERRLETYKTQLSLVETQLKAGSSGPDTADLEQLKDNLSELISLTEDALLEVKKQRLLFSLETVETEASRKTESPRSGGGGEGEGKECGESSEDSDDLQGIKCQAPVEEAWGAVNYHNAVVLCRENSDSEEPEKVMVRVLFTHPTYNAMKPCPFFLDGKCRFESSVCKFSHGTVVPFSQLLAYQDPDYSLISTGGKCLAKYSDGLWYQAIISSFDEEFTVHIPSLNKTVQTPIENVFPLEGSESGSSSDDEDLDEEGEGEEGAVVEWIPSGPHRALGDWEKYTTGIGSKLMAKMGYVVGKGLGKSGEGRVEPVEIKILPPGKSLDMCAEMREEGKLRKAPGQEKEGRRRRRRKRRLVETSRIEEEKRVNVFDFLNAKLQKKDSQAESQSVSKPKSGNLNVQLFTVQEDIKSVGKRRQSLKAQFARHKGRDKMMEAHVSEKLVAAQREMEKLQAEERRIERSLEIKSERKKLRIF